MYERLNGVVLRTISYNDKNSIVRVYTDSHGLLSFLLPQSNGKTARMRRALFQPLSLVEIESDITANREIYRIREARCLVPLPSLHSHPVKNAVSLFITELLSHVIVEEEPNAPLFAYISSSVQLLDRLEKGIANFHICFLYNLGIFFFCCFFIFPFPLLLPGCSVAFLLLVLQLKIKGEKLSRLFTAQLRPLRNEFLLMLAKLLLAQS